MAFDFDLAGVITLDDSQLEEGIANAKSGFADIGGNIQSAGMSITKFGAQASLAMAPIVGGLLSSVGSFREFETAMTNAQAILGVTTEEMEALNAQVLAIGGNSRAGPQAAADAFFTIVSGVQDVTTHMDILNASIALSEAGLADLGVTTAGLVAVMNAYDFAADQATFVSDVFTRTVQMGVGTMDEFVAAISPVAGLADSVGISFDELASATAFLTSQGQTASTAATQLQATMTAFLKPSTAMEEALLAMGFTSGEAALQQLGLAGSVDALSTALGGSTDEIAKALGTTQALNAAVALGAEGADAFMDAFQGGVEGATAAAREIQNATDAAGLDRFKSKAEELKIVLGEGLSNALGVLTEKLTPFIDNVIVWADENEELVTQIGLIAIGLAATGVVVTILGTLITAFGVIATLVFGPVGIVILGVAAIILILDEMAKALDFDSVFAMFEEGWNNLVDIVEIGADIIIGLFGLVGDAIMSAITTGINFAVDAVNALIRGFNQLSGLVGGPTLGLLANVGQAAPASETGVPTNPEEMQAFLDWFETTGGEFTPTFEPSPGLLPGTTNPNAQGFQVGGDFSGGQRIKVGETGPEFVRFPMAGTVESAEDSRDRVNIEQVIIHANSRAEGEMAAAGFAPRLKTLLVRNG